MAEIAGLTIGGIGLASLFTTCVDYLDCITLARNHSRDLEVSLTQMSLLNQRLNIWGEIVKAQNNGYELPALREKWPQIGGAVGEALVSIKDAFTDVSALEKRYSLKATPESSSTAMVIHDFNIDRFEKISENLNVLEKQKKKLASVIEEIDDEDSLKLLVEATEENQSTRSASSGHLFINTIVGERVRVTMGNAGNSTIVGYKFNRTNIMNAEVYIGNMSDERVTMGNAGNSTIVGYKFNRTNIMNAEVYIGNMLDAALASFYSALKGPELGKE
ncbi:hypothetical protein HYALB_00013392 [Hymenoscyphus albidus]|uniref:Prion-inhibition and propagation HeLo domain-containing protein n=1 Tax=Hymenoscyphus albidus TaxID=595503 RepID=A0A9N9LUT8_9HELO|nr:hypothetical protein HYALB_00013392 [Hymenoscyphus albidus]